MLSKKVALVMLSQTFLVSMLWAGTDKACLKKAKADHKTELATCKDMKGAERKSCIKNAKANYKAAKEACKT